MIASKIGKLLGADFILTGLVIEMIDSVIIFGRIINSKTEIVESAAQVIVPKNKEIQELLYRQ